LKGLGELFSEQEGLGGIMRSDRGHEIEA
jgi:hypothetical protein